MRQLTRITLHAGAMMILLALCQAFLPWPAYQFLLTHISIGWFSVFSFSCACCMNQFLPGAALVYVAVLLGKWPETSAITTVGIPVLAGAGIGILLRTVITQLATKEEDDYAVRPPFRRPFQQLAARGEDRPRDATSRDTEPARGESGGVRKPARQ